MHVEQIIYCLYFIKRYGDRVSLDIVWRISVKDQEKQTVGGIISQKKVAKMFSFG